MENFLIVADWGDIFPAEYVYQADSYELLMQDTTLQNELSRYPENNKIAIYQLTDEQLERYLKDAKERSKNQKKYKESIKNAFSKLEKRGYTPLIITEGRAYGIKNRM